MDYCSWECLHKRLSYGISEMHVLDTDECTCPALKFGEIGLI